MPTCIVRTLTGIAHCAGHGSSQGTTCSLSQVLYRPIHDRPIAPRSFHAQRPYQRRLAKRGMPIRVISTLHTHELRTSVRKREDGSISQSQSQSVSEDETSHHEDTQMAIQITASRWFCMPSSEKSWLRVWSKNPSNASRSFLKIIL